eukprot:CAMPEP_0116006698 /NCGR_PEP_ID=MMETSP0321-20121206/1878_1 /TAXON_ID=163516 /ORGANISM="Leptocylindrus danicus var. danicus, Strain B650" /LENGTH=207 /DNA_ID=CAMNT_0003475291 /DNA_START=406 /DNA_END=1029 /DNA_ORIENTATION=+
MCYFTNWVWSLLGISFLFSGSIPLLSLRGIQIPKVVLKLAILSFETVAPLSLLVSTVVRYAIWENLLKAGGPTQTAKQLKPATVLLQHNANTVFVLAEVFLLGGLPVRLQDIACAPLFGIAYIFFSYFMATRYCNKSDGGVQYLYFFLDTTLGMRTSCFLLMLLVVLVAFYFIFALMDTLLEEIDGGFGTKISWMVLLLSMVCRVRD